MAVEIYIDNQLIDVSEGMPMPFTYSVADIREPDKRNTSWSKTITIPGTKRNNKIFGHCFEIDSVVLYLGEWNEELTVSKYDIVSHGNNYYRNSTGTNTSTDPETDTTNWTSIGSFFIGAFNPNLKKPVRVFADTLSQFDGYCQLLKINITDQKHIEYEIAMVGLLGDIISELGDRTFDDIDLSEWDHDFATDSITLTGRDKLVNSWYGSVYKNGSAHTNIANTWSDSDAYNVLANLTQYEGYRLAISVTPGFTATEGLAEGDWVLLDMPDVQGRYLVLQISESSTTELIYVYVYAHPQMSGTGTIKRSTLDSQTYTGEGYTYPLVDYGHTDGLTYHIGQVLPAVFAKEYIDKIFSLAGYSYTSAFFDSQFFKKLVVPSSVPFFKLSDDEVTDREFKVGSSGSLTTVTHFNNFIAPTNLDDDTSTGFFDPGGHWNATDEYWSVTKAGRYNFKGEVKYKIAYDPDTQAFSNVKVRVAMIVEHEPYGIIAFEIQEHALLSTDLITTSYTTATQTFNINLQNHYFSGATSKTVNGVTTAVNEKVTVRLECEVINLSANTTYFRFGGTPVNGDISIEVLGSTWVENEVVNYALLDGDSVTMNQAKPYNIKLTDFLTSIVRAFNLYVLPDPSKSKGLIIEPRDDFYEDGEVIDWTSKLDTSQRLEIRPMGELDYREYRISYKDDIDKWNRLYKEEFKETYGELKREVENDFVKSKKDYPIVFSPTPSIEVIEPTRVIPQIVSEDGTPLTKNYNVRLLYYSGVKSCERWILKGLNDKSDFFENEGFGLPFYPHAGHVDDAQHSTLDLSFLHPKRVYWKSTTNSPLSYTSNNLYNRFHRKLFEEITDKDSKIVTGYFWLNPVDIATLDFRNLFFIDGHYLRLNKVYDYDPQSNNTTKCEFIKVKQSTITIGTTTPIDNADGNYEHTGPVSRYAGNQYNPKNHVVVGENNNVDPTAMGVMITGSNNIVGANSKNIVIQGNNNFVGSGLSNVSIINSSGIEVTASNVCYLNGKLEQRSDIIEGGENEVRDDFATSEILLIEGGLNTVKNKFSTSTIAILEGGEDTI